MSITPTNQPIESTINPTDPPRGLAVVPPGATDWRSGLLMSGDDDHPTPKPILANVTHALTFCPAWRGVIGYNTPSQTTVMRRCPPWRSVDRWPADHTYHSQWTDQDTTNTSVWMQRQGICVTSNIVHEAVSLVARENKFHPTRDYFESLEWDGEERLDYWLSIYLGAEPTELTEVFGAKFLLSAVARVFHPGCKVDTSLFLEGEQGKMKSTALRVLTHPWFTDELPDIRHKDAAIQFQGMLLVELGELEALQGVSVGKIKQFLARQIDRFRPHYGRVAMDFPRGCVFAGTTNSDTWLKDETGGRRFWPVKVGVSHEIDIDGLRTDRDQLWAEAVARYQAGHGAGDPGCWWLDSEEQKSLAADAQSDRYESDPWDNKIAVFISNRRSIAISEILEHCLLKPAGEWNRGDEMRVSRSLRHFGWEQYRTTNAAKVTIRRYQPRQTGN